MHIHTAGRGGWLIRGISFLQHHWQKSVQWSDRVNNISSVMVFSFCLFSLCVTGLITWMSGCFLRHSSGISDGPWRQQQQLSQTDVDVWVTGSDLGWKPLSCYLKLMFWEISQSETKTWEVSHVGNNEIFLVRRKPRTMDSDCWLWLNTSLWLNISSQESVETFNSVAHIYLFLTWVTSPSNLNWYLLITLS